MKIKAYICLRIALRNVVNPWDCLSIAKQWLTFV